VTQQNDFVHLQPKNNFCTDRNLINDLRHVFPELALFVFYLGKHQHLVPGLGLCVGIPPGGIGFLEAAIAAGDNDAAAVGVLPVANASENIANLQPKRHLRGHGNLIKNLRNASSHLNVLGIHLGQDHHLIAGLQPRLSLHAHAAIGGHDHHA
jgi:hypothetical protein